MKEPQSKNEQDKRIVNGGLRSLGHEEMGKRGVLSSAKATVLPRFKLPIKRLNKNIMTGRGT